MSLDHHNAGDGRGVLLSGDIEWWVERGWLITRDTFDVQMVQPASYDLRLGTAYFKGGTPGELSDDNRELVIGPYELVFVETYERLRMPPNVVGRYDLRLNLCHQGIGLQTGTHADPGYEGKLFSPLFNFSSKEVKLKYKDHFATIEFSYTTTPTKYSKPFPEEGKNLTLADMVCRAGLPTSGLSNLYSEITKAVAQFETLRTETRETCQRVEQQTEAESARARDTVRDVHRRLDGMLGTFLTVTALIVAVLAFVTVPGEVARVLTLRADVPVMDVVWVVAGAWVLTVSLITAAIVYLMTRLWRVYSRDRFEAERREGTDQGGTN